MSRILVIESGIGKKSIKNKDTIVNNPFFNEIKPRIASVLVFTDSMHSHHINKTINL